MENASRLYHVTRDNAFCYHLAHNMGEFDNDMALWYEWVRQFDRVKKGAETSGWNKWAYNFNFER